MKDNFKKWMDEVLSTRVKLIVLWISIMLIYIYADVFSFYRTGYLEEVSSGMMGPLSVSQMSLFSASLLMAIPVFIIIGSLYLKAEHVRMLNIVGGILYMGVNISNLIGENWLYYLFYGAVEIGITLLILCTAIKWKKIKTI